MVMKMENLGKAIMRVPAKRVIEVIQKIVELYKNEKSHPKH